MKNKTKKILAVACLGLVGMVALTGCSMSAEQKAALDLVTEKTENIINLLEKNMEYNNRNLTKEAAYDMLKQAKIKSEYVSEETNIYDINISFFDGLTDACLMHNRIVADLSGNIKKFAGYSDGKLDEVTSFNSLAPNNSYKATVGEDDSYSLEALDNEWGLSSMRIGADVLVQVGIFNFSMDEITKIDCVDGVYTFDIIKTSLEKDPNEEDKYTQSVNYITITIKDYLFQSIKCQIIRTEGTETNINKNNDDKAIEYGYASYWFDGQVVQAFNVEVNYLFGNNVDVSELNAKVADIDSKIEESELSIS